MTDPNQNCPQGLSLTDYPVRSCGRAHSRQLECSSVVYPIDCPPYNRVCGRVTAYRWGTTNAFSAYRSGASTIDDAYVSGLSLTCGSPRTHIWSFASGLYHGIDYHGYFSRSRCPCVLSNMWSSPPFVGNDYFCESVATIGDRYTVKFFSDNALWDGQDHLDPCYGNNNPPWFNKKLNVSTTDDIELRMCFYNVASYANIAIELFELYVQ